MIMITPINRHTGELKKPIEKDITQFTFWLERAVKRGYEPFEINGTLLLRATNEREKNNFWIK